MADYAEHLRVDINTKMFNSTNRNHKGINELTVKSGINEVGRQYDTGNPVIKIYYVLDKANPIEEDGWLVYSSETQKYYAAMAQLLSKELSGSSGDYATNPYQMLPK